MSSFARRLERTASDIPDRFEPWNFGIPHLDSVVKGVRPGFVNLLIARPHVGKTLVALAGIRNNPEIPTMFISADDDPDVVVRKMMQFDGIIEDGWQATRAEMADYITEFYPNLDIVDGVTWGPAAINNQIKLSDAIGRFTDDYEQPPGLVIYDYLGIDGSDYAQTQMIAAWQKETCKIMPMPFLIIAQSNRGGAKMEKTADGGLVRRGFRMEDLAFGGEQQAGLMMGLTSAQRMVNGMLSNVIEVDVVKNKAVFDGSGITEPTDPVVLCHYEGRLTDDRTIRHLVTMRDEALRQGAYGYQP